MSNKFDDIAKSTIRTVDSFCSAAVEESLFVSDKRSNSNSSPPEWEEKSVTQTAEQLINILDTHQESPEVLAKKFAALRTEYRYALENFSFAFHSYAGIFLQSVTKNALESPEDFVTQENALRTLTDPEYGDKYLGDLLNRPDTYEQGVLKAVNCLTQVHDRAREIDKLFEDKRAKIERVLQGLAKSIGLTEDMIKVRVAQGSQGHYLYRGTGIITIPAEALLNSSDPEVRQRLITQCLENVYGIKQQADVAHAVIDAQSVEIRSRIGAVSSDLPYLTQRFTSAIGVDFRSAHMDFVRKVLILRNGKSMPKEHQEAAMKSADKMKDFHADLAKDRSHQLEEYARRGMLTSYDPNKFGVYQVMTDLGRMVESSGCNSYLQATTNVFGKERIQDPLKRLLILIDRFSAEDLTYDQKNDVARLVLELVKEDVHKLNASMRETNERTYTASTAQVKRIAQSVVKDLAPRVTPSVALPNLSIVEATNKPAAGDTSNIVDFFNSAVIQPSSEVVRTAQESTALLVDPKAGSNNLVDKDFRRPFPGGTGADLSSSFLTKPEIHLPSKIAPKSDVQKSKEVFTPKQTAARGLNRFTFYLTALSGGANLVDNFTQWLNDK